MKQAKRPNGYWNLETLRVEALKYQTRQEFQQKNGAAYKAAGLLKLRDAICGHMIKLKNPKGYWTPETLHAEALKYNNKVDFRQRSNPAFLTASRRGLLDLQIRVECIRFSHTTRVLVRKAALLTT